MFGNLRDKFIALVTSRLFMLAVVLVALFSLLVHRLFVLQIVDGESYLNNFTLRIKREKTIKSTRGSIYDRNGVVLASDKLAYSVTIQDNYDSTSTKNMELNDEMMAKAAGVVVTLEAYAVMLAVVLACWPLAART